MAVSGDPVAANSPAARRVFAELLRRRARRAFHAVRVARSGPPEPAADRRVIVFTNHPCWWDPVVFVLLDRVAFAGREGYGPMEAAQLARYPFMRRIGIFGVAPGRAGAAGFLRTAEGILADPRRMLWITAQGRFADPRDRPLALAPGVAHLMARLDGAVAVPLALEYPFWSESRPEALCRFGEPLPADGAPARAWRPRLEAALEETMDALRDDALSWQPERFQRLLRGRGGVGGVYDAWRGARARLRGERFRPDHRAEEG